MSLQTGSQEVKKYIRRRKCHLCKGDGGTRVIRKPQWWELLKLLRINFDLTYNKICLSCCEKLDEDCETVLGVAHPAKCSEEVNKKFDELCRSHIVLQSQFKYTKTEKDKLRIENVLLRKEIERLKKCLKDISDQNNGYTKTLDQSTMTEDNDLCEDMKFLDSDMALSNTEAPEMIDIKPIILEISETTTNPTAINPVLTSASTTVAPPAAPVSQITEPTRIIVTHPPDRNRTFSAVPMSHDTTQCGITVSSGPATKRLRGLSPSTSGSIGDTGNEEHIAVLERKGNPLDPTALNNTLQCFIKHIWKDLVVEKAVDDPQLLMRVAAEKFNALPPKRRKFWLTHGRPPLDGN